MQPRSSYVTVTDMFCGAGGSSIGVVRAGAELKMAMNHWALAIESHNTNFPDSDHSLTDIRTADPRRYPTTDVLIASPECTAHALAKGRKRKDQQQLDLFGKSAFDPAEEKSRATMWDVPRFAEYHRYNIVIVENVVDAALYWEPFQAWLLAMAALGYEHEAVFFNSMFAHPTPQSRDRLYVVFWRRGNRKPDLTITPPAWCAQCQRDVEARQSWKKQTRRIGKYGQKNQYLYRCPSCHEIVQPYYYAAANCIDWTQQGERIGDRKVPLKPKTLERIRYGLQRFSHRGGFVTNTAGDSAFVMGQERPGTPGRVYPVDGPMPTQTGWQDKALVRVPWLMGMHGDYWTFRGMNEAVPTQVATGSTTALVCPPFVAEMHGESRARGVDEALSTIASSGAHHGLVSPPFLVSPNHRSVRASAVDAPFPTQTASVGHGLVTPPMLLGQQSGAVARLVSEATPTVSTAGGISLIVPAGGTWNEDARSTAEPFPTQTTREMYGVIQAPPFLMSFYGKRHGTHAIEDPMVTQAARDNHALVMPGAMIGANRSHNILEPVTGPVRTIVAGGNQHFLLIPFNGTAGQAHPVSDPTRTVTTHDREALLGMSAATLADVEDCRFRMLQWAEIRDAMAFPRDYVIKGTSRDKVRQLGNAVTPPVMALLFQRCVATLAG